MYVIKKQGDCMDKFKISKSRESNIIKSIRFSEELNNQIIEAVNKANKGKTTKEYSFNGFVCSACEYALKNMD